tara:strand:- start:90 stop:509 length:420 start_codon:yes stop_codon:yes gene_type:complete
MAVSFTNAWKVSVEETIQNAVKNEFFGSIPVFRTPNFKFRGNNFMTISALDSFSNNSMYSVIPNTFNLQLTYYHYDSKRNDLSVKKFFKQISRLEEVFYSLLGVSPSYSFTVQSINYEDDDEMEGFRKAIFNVQVSNIR